MEVSGKKATDQFASSVLKTSDEDFKFYCNPCSNDGAHVEAVGYCKNCSEFLCIMCFKYHRKTNALRNHILLGKDKMPKKQHRPMVQTECTQKCPDHPQEVIIYYCKLHDQIGCHVCMADKHSHCENEFIPDIANRPENKTVFGQTVEKLEDMENQANQTLAKAKLTRDEVEMCYSSVIQKIEKARCEINSHLDKLQTDVLNEAGEIKSEKQAALDNVMREYRSLIENVRKVRTQLEETTDNSSEKFVLMKQSKFLLEENEIVLRQTVLPKRISPYKFEPNDELFANILNQQTFGILSFNEEGKDLVMNTQPVAKVDEITQLDVKTQSGANSQIDVNAQSHLIAKPDQKQEHFFTKTNETINIKTDTDLKDCNISGIAQVSTDVIALADNNNACIKFVTLNKDGPLQRITLSSHPWDIAVLQNGKVAVVTLPYVCLIQHISKSDTNTWHTSETRKTNGRCRGISISKDKVFVSFDLPPKVEIQNLNGDVLKTIASGLDGKSLFNQPWYLAAAADGSYIYVSDKGSRTLTRISAKEDKKNTKHLAGDGIFLPEGIAATGQGSILVCDMTPSGNIHILSEDLVNHQVGFCKTEGLISPQAVCYSRDRGQLFVCCYDASVSNLLFIFKTDKSF